MTKRRRFFPLALAIAAVVGIIDSYVAGLAVDDRLTDDLFFILRGSSSAFHGIEWLQAEHLQGQPPAGAASVQSTVFGRLLSRSTILRPNFVPATLPAHLAWGYVRLRRLPFLVLADYDAGSACASRVGVGDGREVHGRSLQLALFKKSVLIASWQTHFMPGPPNQPPQPTAPDAAGVGR